MDSVYFSFFVSKSIDMKSCDLGYKVCLGKPACYIQIAVPQIRFLIGFLDSNGLSAQNMRSLVGFTKQIFSSGALFSTKYFGLKNSTSVIRFWQLGYSKILKYFWFYCPDTIVSKFVMLGVKGNRFKYLRFLVFDIFNFFGGEFYQSFYLNYFDFPGFFVTDFFPQVARLVSERRYYNHVFSQLAYIRVFFTFFKCLL